jgi:ATP-dependent Clp protease protease subunit
MNELIVEGYIVATDDEDFMWWMGMPYVSPRVVRERLAELNGEDLVLKINSYGGDVWAACDMYALLKDYSGRVTAEVTGLAASSATIMMCGCDEVIAWPGSQFMIHNPRGYAEGEQSDMEAAAQQLETGKAGIVAIYTAKTGQPPEALADLMDKETWFSATQAMEIGLIDRIKDVQGALPLVAANYKVDWEQMRAAYQDHLVKETEEQKRAAACIAIERQRFMFAD